jgi:hypothetical protein
MLTLEVRTIFTDRIPTFHVLEKVLNILALKSSTLHHQSEKCYE